MTPSSDDPTPAAVPVTAPQPEETAGAHNAQHPDPITGEPGAHPVGVAIGAIGAGIAGATIGVIGGPIGMIVGAAIGAVAGGLAGKEVAEVDDSPEITDSRVLAEPTAESERPMMNLDPMIQSHLLGATMTELPGAGVGAFHDHLTATTFGEAEEENRLTGDDEPSSGSQSPTEETVRTAAYFRYLDRQSTDQPGDALGDWVAAEQEVLA